MDGLVGEGGGERGGGEGEGRYGEQAEGDCADEFEGGGGWVGHLFVFEMWLVLWGLVERGGMGFARWWEMGKVECR